MSKRRFAVLGLGQFGTALSVDLAKLGCEVLAVDRSLPKVEAIRDKVTRACAADIRDRAALEELITSPYNAAVIAMGNSLEAAILATLHLKDLGIEEVWVEASTPDRAEVLKRVGATRVFSPERDMGRRVAQSLSNPNLIEFLPLTEGYGVVEVEAPSWLHGKTLAEVDLRRTMHLAVIAMRETDGTTRIAPGGQAKIQQGSVLTLVGSDEHIRDFYERK